MNALKRRQSEARANVLVLANHDVDLSLHHETATSILLRHHDEDLFTFRERLTRKLDEAKGSTRVIFVIDERALHRELLYVVISALPRGTRLVLAAAEPSPTAERTLAALALSVTELAEDVKVVVDLRFVRASANAGWRGRVDRALRALTELPPGVQRTA